MMLDLWEDFEEHLRFYQHVCMISTCTTLLVLYLCT